MTKTYAQIQKQIAQLQKQAEHVRQAEIAGVVTRIKEAIEAYGITASDLGLGSKQTPAAKKAPSVKKARKTSAPRSKLTTEPKFRDAASGKVWVGRGPRPQWLRDALSAGKSLADFAV